jgi:hypothetical protein
VEDEFARNNPKYLFAHYDACKGIMSRYIIETDGSIGHNFYRCSSVEEEGEGVSKKL